MTGRIVSGDQRRRFRIIGPTRNREMGKWYSVRSELAPPAIRRPYKHMSKDRPDGLAYEADELQPLPRIPDWPLPGPAPQFLSDAAGCPIQVGDRVVVSLAPDNWRIYIVTGIEGDNFLGQVQGPGIRKWLVSRANPEVDA